MKTFEYRGLAMDGKPCRGLVEALTLKEAREKLAAEGVLAERIAVSARVLRLDVATRASMYRELAALLAAGIPLVRALDLLIQAVRGGSLGGMLAAVRDRVREGATLADALADGVPGELGRFEYAVIRAGERAGSHAVVLERLAVFIEDQARLRERVQQALIYPALVVGVGLCVAILMLGLLVPRAAGLLADHDRALPGLTRALMAVGTVGWRIAVPVILALVIAGVLARRRYRHEAAFRERWDRQTFRWPAWGRHYALLCRLRFARTLALLMRGGVPLVDALGLAGGATGSPWVERRVDAVAQAVRHGARLSDALREVPPLADQLPGWLRVGEESGDLGGMLEHAGRRFADQWDREMARFLALLEPILLLAIGGFVLIVTLAVLLPILSLTQTVTIR